MRWTMTKLSVPAGPARSGDTGPEAPRRSPYAKRRTIFLLASVVILLAVAAFANYGPLRSYVDARERLEKATTELAALEERRADLQALMGKLTEAGYLESVAREELTYARPGEELYIITGTGEESDATQTAGKIGLFRKVLSAFEGLD